MDFYWINVFFLQIQDYFNILLNPEVFKNENAHAHSKQLQLSD